MIKRRDFLKTGLAAPLFLSRSSAAARKPNIVLIVADDLGYGDLGCRAARTSPRRTSTRSRATACASPTATSPARSAAPRARASTPGRYQQRFGHEFNPGPALPATEKFGLPLTETTIADRLKAPGYATGMVGKWHLGYQPEFHPQKRGFDEFFGFLGGAHSYVDAAGRQGQPDPARHRSRWTRRSTSPTPSRARRWRSSTGTSASRSSSTCRSTPSTRRCRPRRSTWSASRTSRTNAAPHLRRHAVGDGRRRRPRAGEAARHEERGEHADLLHQRQRRPDAQHHVAQRAAARLQGTGARGRHPRAVHGAVEGTHAGRARSTASR